MSDIVFEQKNVDLIEMFVSTCGKYTGMSIGGVARMCGVASQTIWRLCEGLDNPVSAKPVPKKLEHLRQKVYIDSLVSSNYTVNGNVKGKILTSESTASIIEYYAFDSKSSNQLAVNSYRQFAKRGIDDWIKEVTGFKPEPKDITLPLDAVKEMHRLVGERIAIADLETRELPGMGILLTAHLQPQALPGQDKLPTIFSVTDYLRTKGIVSRSQSVKFGQYLSFYYRGMKLIKPVKQFPGNVNGYSHEQIKLLDSAFDAFQLS
jgi:hypothetical protein